MSPNDVVEFVKRETAKIADEYNRTRQRVTEDPGTAGDQTEENWAGVLRRWLPSYYKVVTKGRILSIGGIAGPQLDVVVLSPAYPEALVESKLYPAGGVIAAFECKTTLRSCHLKKFFENCIEIRKLSGSKTGTPVKELRPNIFYGLLAHSNEWTAPYMTIENAINALDKEVVTRPIDMPDFFCVADAGTCASLTSTSRPSWLRLTSTIGSCMPRRRRWRTRK